MALHINGGCFTVMGHSRVRRISAVASDGSATTLKTVDDKVKLGGSDLKVSAIGIGAWAWGDTTYWNNFQWNDRKEKAARDAFNTSIDGGLTFFDTAEVYGSGLSFGAINSETLLGRFIKERKAKDPNVEVTVATKYAALPWRLGRQSVISALKDSLGRLEMTSVDVYQLHWPGVWGNEEKRLREAYKQLKKRGIPLASNQVNYSLIYRTPEENGVKATCDELGITLIAYSPIAQGVLTGKYTPENPPTGPRGRIYTPEFLTTLKPLLNKITEIGDKYNKTATQVSLNWLVAQGNVVPIPGAKTPEQAEEFKGALGWKLTNEEVTELRSLASKIKSVIGFPVEKL
ncbi:hypothetical protein TSUD_131700 [Trifolium subterraneum]|uniref:NADP-dependent oxidoreductase domain-containing protein n=1 Tax=Trifolium subterraneum TaxID=3900 RepID=A0A2Z6LS87_TRISU|nr:hypothetical protein TSUD_131700 [Trifolium subterraneum]